MRGDGIYRSFTALLRMPVRKVAGGMCDGIKNWKIVLPPIRHADEKLWTPGRRLFSLSNVRVLK
ncbi:hypothetical protein CN068_33380 [Sinorhizobium meliloti]|nr:hypothetical protein CN068_33380 [Sinorhizobium meliloti]